MTFKRFFLGVDVWGRYAEIQNEDILNFKCEYETKPLDLTIYSGKSCIESVLHFMKELSIIRKNGTTPINSPVFGPLIGTKRLGARLPNDYSPTN